MKKDTEKKQMRRYLNGTYMTLEVDELHDTLRDALMDDNGLEEVAAEVWEEAADARRTSVFAEKESYKEAQRLLTRLKHRRIQLFKRFSYVAAGIAASILLVFLGIYGASYQEEPNVQMAQLTTNFGERREVVLADGSRIVLNACSTLEYPEQFTGDTREVKLNGQAFFDIAHKEDQPFFVETGKFHVEVLGTAFDVKSYAEDEIVSVEVQRGKVEVTLPEATLRLKKEEQILMNTVSGEFNKKRGNKEVATWRKGSLCFNHTPIKDVARELERVYNRDIRFSEGQEFTNVITGEHDNQSLESVLESLHYVSGLNYRTEADGSIVIYK